MSLFDRYCLDIDALDEPNLLKKHRRHAQEALFSLKIPNYLEPILSHSYERLSSEEIVSPPLKKYVLEGCEESYIIFMNGHLRLDLSNIQGLKNAVFLPFTKALRSYAPLFESFYSSILQSDKDPLFLLNLASYQEGAFLYIPPNAHFEKPLQILSCTKGTNDLWTAPRLHLVLGHHSSLTLLETTAHEGLNKVFHTSSSTFDLADGSSLQHALLDLSSTKTSSYHGTGVRAFLKKEASFSSTSALRGPFHRDSKKIVLQEEGASTSLQGGWIGAKEDQLHTSIHVEHMKPFCRSKQLFKGVVAEKSSSSFDGTIKIHEQANMSEAYELNNNLLLGKEAKASSYPNLEIYAEDVKAHHGVTYGKLDKEALFYMKSRGLPSHEAEKLLIGGFMHEILQEIPHPAMKEKAFDWMHSLPLEE